MPFDPVDPRQSFPQLERGILRYWQEEDVFHRSVKQRKDGERFSFYDGPPFATGLPHYGHLLAGTIKDVIPRYQTMRGKYVERRFGWDCHGLPVENLIEKEHNIKHKGEIEAMGVAAFNGLCRAAVQRYTKEWRTVVERTGRFVDMDWDYRTMDPDFMESIFWVFSQLAEKGLLYEGHKPMHLCPRCVTPLANFEVTQGYKDITDQSAIVQFELTDTPGTYALAWTTTPWTLPGNLFLAIGPHISYVEVEHDGKTYILAKERVEATFGKREYTVGKTVTHKQLVGRTYKPLFPYYVDRYKDAAFKIVATDFVETGEGTGIVHIAPGFGEDDYGVGKKEKVPLLQHVSIEGVFQPEVTDFAGMEVKPKDDPTKTDQKVIAWLESHGLLFERVPYKHSYPHCWRCDSPLLNYATSSWFVAVEKIKDDLLAANAKTEWVPGHLRDGRFGKWLEGARDWAISRNRYWGTPLPLWRADKDDTMPVVIGGRDDILLRNKIRFTKITAVRHAQSEGNVQHIYQGVVPGTSLTKLGKEQAAATGKKLAADTVPVDVIYCSPLARTQQTAQAIGKETGATVIVDERLHEIEFGEFEGKSVTFHDLDFVKARRAHVIEKNHAESIYHLPGMETWESAQKRINDFLSEVLPRHRSQHIVVVSHADPILNIKHFFTKEEPRKLWHQPCPDYAQPHTFFWDHDHEAQFDLHKEVLDTVVFAGNEDKRLPLLTLVRHGETDYNKNKIMQGRSIDPPLNADGRAQVEATARKLKAADFDMIVSSTQKRAMETADILSDILGIPVVERLEMLCERDGGSWAGKKESDVTEHSPHAAGGGNLSFHQGTPEGGESLSQFLLRGQNAYDTLCRKYPGKRVLVATHGGMVRAMRTLVENWTYAEASTSHCHNADTVTLPRRALLRRIPEVLDCWFESGSMPYAQVHHPFASDGTLPQGFPADFIAEGIDQTRGWFYTLTVLGAALFQKPAFQHCITNGTVLAEDGRKMSKRLQNYPDPTAVLEKHGADAMRFALMSSQAVRGEDMRFSEKILEDTLRNMLLPLWNAYGFFVTYANAANFTPVADRRHSGHPLDKWIRAEVQDLCNRMSKELDSYDLSATCAELHDTIDALTNWYIRLSRRRFAGKLDADELEGGAADEEQQHEALATLYDVLLTLSQLLAPFCPFITEAIYLNLVPENHGSVHLTDWPAIQKLTKEESKLLANTRVMRTIVSLGLKLRSQKTIKVRQPLSKITVALPPALRTSLKLAAEDEQVLRQELNVKEIEFVDDPGTLGERIAQVDARKVGPRLGGRVQEVIAAGKRGEFEIRDDGSIVILEETLSPDEAAVLYRGREGTDVAAEHGIVVSLETVVTPELKAEGLMRDLVRAVQKLRKDGGLAYTDQIILQIDGLPDELTPLLPLLHAETRAKAGKVDGAFVPVELDGATLSVGFIKA